MDNRRRRGESKDKEYSRLTVEIPEDLLMRTKIFVIKNKTTIKKMCETAIRDMLSKVTDQNVTM